MRSSPTVSVVTPVYNTGEYLAECIESVLDQTYTEYGDKTYGQLIRLTHELAEWESSYAEGTSTPISLRAMLEALGQEDRYEELSKSKIEDAHFAKLFGN